MCALKCTHPYSHSHTHIHAHTRTQNVCECKFVVISTPKKDDGEKTKLWREIEKSSTSQDHLPFFSVFIDFHLKRASITIAMVKFMVVQLRKLHFSSRCHAYLLCSICVNASLRCTAMRTNPTIGLIKTNDSEFAIVFCDLKLKTKSTFDYIFQACLYIYIHVSLFLCNFRPDVWFLTTTQALQWITDPKPLKALNNYEPWDCLKKQPNVQKPCNISNKCALPFKTQESNITDTRYMETCRDCPAQYPWLGDSEGTGILGRDNYNFNTNDGNAEEEEQTDETGERRKWKISMAFEHAGTQERSNLKTFFLKWFR